MGTFSEAEYIAALIELHRGCDRKGPGDAAFSRHILDSLPELPQTPRIADLGCGSGAGSLLLAQYYQSSVKAVELSAEFLDELMQRAEQAGLAHLIEPVCRDMANLDWPAGSIDLLWSEGAAYNLGFEQALETWRPLLAKGGIAVVSEISWLKNDVPEPARAYWQGVYPAMGSEAENIARARQAGFEVLATQQLPSQAWWTNYYEPLRGRMAELEISPAAEAVIEETRAEMALFETYSDFYGYTFYVLRVRD